MDSSSSSSPSPSPSSSSSLVSKARTALHSAATKAEKVLTDIRADLKSSDRDRGDGQPHRSAGKNAEGRTAVSAASESPVKSPEEEIKYSKWKPISLGKKQDWQQSLKNLGIGKKDVEEEKFDKALSDNFVAADVFQQKQGDILVAKDMGTSGKGDGSSPQKTNLVPPASVLKNLAAAVEKGTTFKSVKDLLRLDSNSLPMKERTGLSFSMVKSLMLRDKEEKLNPEVCGNMEMSSTLRLVFDSEELSTERKIECRSETFPVIYIRGAPPESFLVKVSEITGSFKSLHKMVSFWHSIVAELRRLWSECKPIPHMPLDENPDLDCCHLHQQLQVINCCVARKLRRTVAMESLDSAVSIDPRDSSVDFFKLSVNPMTYVRIRTGDHVLRLGANRPSKNLTMLETGEPVYSPVTQEGPVLTEELIKETEEFVLRTGSIGAGCSKLLSDMQAFKAANPGSILEDFVRWYSPPDWEEEKLDCDEDASLKRGCLSGRMQKEGNLWRELWEAAKPLPAAKQAPLFDEDLAVESILTSMEDMAPSELLEQQFLSLLYSGFAIAESALSIDKNFSKLFYDCKEYVVATCQNGLSSENIGELCKVYETIETILTRPEEVSWVSEERISEEPKSRLKKLSLPFVGRDKLLKRASKEQQKTDDRNIRMFSNLFDEKSDISCWRRKVGIVSIRMEDPRFKMCCFILLKFGIIS